MNITIKLTDAQGEALAKLELMDKAQEVVEQAVKTAVRTRFKYMVDQAEKKTGESYDFVVSSGAKIDMDKGAFVTHYMHALRAILNEL